MPFFDHVFLCIFSLETDGLGHNRDNESSRADCTLCQDIFQEGVQLAKRQSVEYRVYYKC